MSSGGPSATRRPPCSPPPGPRSTIQSEAARNSEVVLDRDDRVPARDQAPEASRAAGRRLRRGARSSARRRGRACRAPRRAGSRGTRRASGAAPRRPRASPWAGRAAGSRGPRRRAAAGGCAICGSSGEEARPRPRPSSRARRRCSCRGSARRARGSGSARRRTTSQRTVTSARNCMSIVCQPVPLQASQRPPGALKEKSRAVSPRETARAAPREDLADLVPGLHVGHRVRARRAAERALVHEQDVGDALEALDRGRAPRRRAARRPSRGARRSCRGRRGRASTCRSPRRPRRRRGARAGAARSGPAGCAARAPTIVIAPSARRNAHEASAAAAAPRRPEPAARVRAPPAGELAPVAEARTRASARGVPSKRSWPPRLPAPGPRSITWSAASIDLRIVLDDDDRVAAVGQAPQDPEQPPRVGGVEADRRLVEDVERAGQRAAERRGEADPLRLAARERPRGAARASGSRGRRRSCSARATGSRRRPTTSRSSSAGESSSSSNQRSQLRRAAGPRARRSCGRGSARRAPPARAARRGTPGRACRRGSGRAARGRGSCSAWSRASRRSPWTP